MTPDAESFEISMDSPVPSISRREAVITGRLQVWVNSGSQYATWRQFPEAIQYEIRLPSGQLEMKTNLEKDITEAEGPNGEDPLDSYAAEPSNRVVGKSFDANLFDYISGFMTEPGRYGVRAHYQGSVSNWLDFDLAP